MNKENFTKLIKCLKEAAGAKTRPKFDMSDWVIGFSTFERSAGNIDTKIEPKEGFCGTSACIAGHAAILSGVTNKALLDDQYDVRGEAKEWLGIGDVDAEKIFDPNLVIDLSKLTVEESIVMLENYKETGKVVWAGRMCARRPEVYGY